MTLQRDYEFRRENQCRIILFHIGFLHIIISFLVDERLNFAIRLTKPEYFTRRNQEITNLTEVGRSVLGSAKDQYHTSCWKVHGGKNKDFM